MIQKAKDLDNEELLGSLKKIVELSKIDSVETSSFFQNASSEIHNMIMFVLKKYLKRQEFLDIRIDAIHDKFGLIKGYLEYIQKLCGCMVYTKYLSTEQLYCLMEELLKNLLVGVEDKELMGREGEMSSAQRNMERQVLNKLLNSGIIRMLGGEQNQVY